MKEADGVRGDEQRERDGCRVAAKKDANRAPPSRPARLSLFYMACISGSATPREVPLHRPKTTLSAMRGSSTANTILSASSPLILQSEATCLRKRSCR